jgi:hypothetical protein
MTRIGGVVRGTFTPEIADIQSASWTNATALLTALDLDVEQMASAIIFVNETTVVGGELSFQVSIDGTNFEGQTPIDLTLRSGSTTNNTHPGGSLDKVYSFNVSAFKTLRVYVSVQITSGTMAVTMTGTSAWGHGIIYTLPANATGSFLVDTELTTADLDTGAGTDTRAVVGLVLAASGGGLLVGSANPMPVSDNGGSLTVDGTVTASYPNDITQNAALTTGTLTDTLTIGNGISAVSVRISGTWVGTLSFECSVDATLWDPIYAVRAGVGTAHTTINESLNDNIFRFTAASFRQLRVTFTRTSGTANLSWRASYNVSGVYVGFGQLNTVQTVNTLTSITNTVTVDSELPAAAAMSDTMANPTAPAVAAHSAVWDGTDWARALEAAAGLNTTGTGLPVGAIAAQFDDTSTTAVTENRFAHLRIDADRQLRVRVADTLADDLNGAGVPLPVRELRSTTISGGGQASIGTTQVLIASAYSGRLGLLIVQHGTVDVYLGTTGVTSSTGVLLPGIKGAAISIPTTAAVYGITASGSQTISWMELA